MGVILLPNQKELHLCLGDHQALHLVTFTLLTGGLLKAIGRDQKGQSEGHEEKTSAFLALTHIGRRRELPESAVDERREEASGS